MYRVQCSFQRNIIVQMFFLRICIYKRVFTSACCFVQLNARQHSSRSHNTRPIITTLSPSDSSDSCDVDTIVSPSLSLLVGNGQLCCSSRHLLTCLLSQAPASPQHARPLNASIGLAPHSLKPANDGVHLVGGGCSPTLLWLWLTWGGETRAAAVSPAPVAAILSKPN